MKLSNPHYIIQRNSYSIASSALIDNLQNITLANVVAPAFYKLEWRWKWSSAGQLPGPTLSSLDYSLADNFLVIFVTKQPQEMPHP